MPNDLAALLVEEGAAPADKVARAQERQREAGGALDTALLEVGAISEEALLPYLARVSELPAAPEGAWSAADARARRVFPSRVAERHGLAPFALDGRELSLVAIHPVDLVLLDEISFMLSLHLTAHVGLEWRVRELIHRLYGTPLPERLAALAAAAGVIASDGEAGGRERVDLPPPSPPPTGFERDQTEPLEPLAAALAQAVESLELPPDGEAPEPEEPQPARDEAAARDEGPDRSAPPHWSLDAARAALAAARDRDEVVLVALRYARDFFEFAAMFAVTRDAVAGHDALGSEEARERVRAIAIWSADPGIARTVIDTMSPYLGPVSRDQPGNEAILAGLGREAPRTALVFPVVMRDRTVAILYADNGEAPVSARRLGDLLLLLSGVGAAFERIIRARKQPVGGAARSAPEPSPQPVSVYPRETGEGGGEGSRDEAPATEPEEQAFPDEPAPGAEAAESPRTDASDTSRREDAQAAPQGEDAAPSAPREPEKAAPEETGDDGKELAAAPAPESSPEPAPDAARSDEAQGAPEPAGGAPEAAAGASTAAPGAFDAAPASVEVDLGEEAPNAPAPDEARAAASATSSTLENAPASVDVDLDEAAQPKGQDESPRAPETVEAASSLDDLERQFFGDAALGSIATPVPGAPAVPVAAPVPAVESTTTAAPESAAPATASGLAAATETSTPPPAALVPAARNAPAAPADAAAPATPAALADRALDPDPAVAAAACEDLAARRRDPALRPAHEKLRRALLSGIAARTTLAARALGALRDVEAIPLLVQAMETSAPEPARAVADALERITLQRLGTDARKWLAWWKKNRGRGRAEWLFSCLTSADRDVRVAADAELRETAEAPIEYSPDMPPPDRERAARALAVWWARSGHVL